jgi:transposase
MKILALDLGKFNTMCCFFDSKTRKHTFLNAKTDRAYLTTVFKKHKIDLVVMEACGPSGWINDLARSLKLETLVCSTNEDAWKWSNVKRKTDKDDALKLARMASMGELKAVHMPSETHREFRSLVKYRKTLDGRINKMKCTIRAWFVNHGIAIDAGDKAWHTGRDRINSFRKPLVECKPNELWRGELDIELTQMDALAEHLAIVVKRLEVIGKIDPRIVRLRTIPGVGARTAEILVACLDDPHRWSSSLGLLRPGSSAISVRRDRPQRTNHEARQPIGQNDFGRMCLGFASLQPMGQSCLRSSLWQAKDAQEKSCDCPGPQDCRSRLGHAERRERLGPQHHD